MKELTTEEEMIYEEIKKRLDVLDQASETLRANQQHIDADLAYLLMGEIERATCYIRGDVNKLYRLGEIR